MKQISDNSGFTLIEATVSIGIFTMIIVGLLSLVSFILTSGNSQSTLLSNNSQALRVAFNIIKELRNAKASASGSYALDTAAAQQLIFYSDNGTTIDRINYFIQNGVLKKGITKPTGSPATYNLGQEVVTTVQNDVANGGNTLFYYYPDTYNGVTDNPLTQPVNVTRAKFIKINLSVYNKGGVANAASYTVTAGGTIRNLKVNLGN
jgi:type II secretory pathway pseudopilin PulG